MKRIPWWTVASAGTAPVILAGGWTLAASRQPPGYSSIHDTISALAAHGATDRWIMTSALAGLGVCHIVTAAGLRPAELPGRVVLAGGGLATVLVATFPQPAAGNSTAHTIVAAFAFGALSVWPLFASGRTTDAPLLTRTASRVAATSLLALLAWFAFELHGSERGLAERAAAGAQALWPLAVVISTRRTLARRAHDGRS